MKNKIILCIMLFHSSFCFAQIDIDSARSQGVGAIVTITGIVTNGSELGPIRYIQDNTGGMALYDPTTLANAQRGDEITVTGTLVDYNGLMEMNPVTSYNINSSNNTVVPQLITPLQIGETTESELIPLMILHQMEKQVKFI